MQEKVKFKHLNSQIRILDILIVSVFNQNLNFQNVKKKYIYTQYGYIFYIGSLNMCI